MTTSPGSTAAVEERILYPALEEIDDDVETEVPRRRDTVLLGDGAILDSLALVTFLVAVEERLESETGVPVRLVNDKAMSRRASPFRTLGTLADHISELLAQR